MFFFLRDVGSFVSWRLVLRVVVLGVGVLADVLGYSYGWRGVFGLFWLSLGFLDE